MRRLKLIQVLVILTCLAIIVRLFYWQFLAGIEKRTLQSFAEDEIPAPRGDILASDNFPLATNQEAYLIFATPKNLKDNPRDISRKLAPILITDKPATGSAFGLEGFYNSTVKGKPGKQNSSVDPQGVPIMTGKFSALSPKKGSTLITSIDRTIQFIAELKIKEAVEKYGAKDGTVIISDPKNGHVLAMATYPNYNPAFFGLYDQKLYKNLAVADNYEPGSTFKLVTMSAAMDLNLVTPQTKCDVCTGPRKVGGYEISTWNNKYYPDSTMTEVIEHSDNVGMTFVAGKLGVDKFVNYINKFGFGKKTGIDLEEETTGSIHDKRDWREIDLATGSFGQGLTVTPIQIVQAVQAIANGGQMFPPRLVQSVVDGGKTDSVKPPAAVQIISPQSATQMTEMMVNAVDHGEAQFFKPKGYRIAGKTGTAQIPVAGHYDPNKTIASFVGFAPAQNPKFVMLVRFTEPTASTFGAETAAPTFFAIAKELFNYYGISPSE
ncbi:penicillin-binding protein 2 [Candidatus Curtissbacteria bacterium]|nr:penicillin-binding protein 2 [Candidatus Curtissbacteria bacterium]